MRIEQKLNFELEFELGNRTIPATEIVNPTNVYWLVNGTGLEALVNRPQGVLPKVISIGESEIKVRLGRTIGD